MISKVRLVYNLIFLMALVLAVSVFKDSLKNFSLPGQLEPIFLVIAIFGQLVFWFLNSLSWALVVKQFSSIHLSILKGFIQCSVVAVGKYLPGKIWGLVNRGIDLNRQGLSNQSILLVNYLDQVLLLHTGLIIGSLAYSFCVNRFLFGFTIITSLCSFFVVPLSHSYLSSLLKNRINVCSVEYLFERVFLYRYIGLAALYLIMWLVAGVIFSFIYFWLYGFEINFFPILISANAAGIILGFLAVFAPGGIGVREATSIALLIIYLPHEQAFVLVVVYRVWTISTDILGGACGFILSHFFQRRSMI